MDKDKTLCLGDHLVIQRLRLYTPNAGGLGSIPGPGIRAHMPQLKRSHVQLRPSAAR